MKQTVHVVFGPGPGTAFVEVPYRSRKWTFQREVPSPSSVPLGMLLSPGRSRGEYVVWGEVREYPRKNEK